MDTVDEACFQVPLENVMPDDKSSISGDYLSLKDDKQTSGVEHSSAPGVVAGAGAVAAGNPLLGGDNKEQNLDTNKEYQEEESKFESRAASSSNVEKEDCCSMCLYCCMETFDCCIM